MNLKILFILLFSLFCLSQSGNIIRFCDAHAFSIAFYRLFLAFILMSPLVLWKSYPGWKKIEKKTFLRISLMGFVFALHLITWIKGVQQTKVANAAMCFCVNPVFISLGAYFFLKEKIHKNLLCALIIGMAGIFCIAYDDFCASLDFLWGDVLALLSGVLFAIYFLLGKKLRETTESLILMNMVYFFSAMTCLVFVFWEKTSIFIFSSRTWMAFFAMAIVPTILGHFLFIYVSKFLKAGASSVSTLLEPVFAGIIAYIAFSEKINILGIAGYLFILLSMIFLFFSNPQEAKD